MAGFGVQVLSDASRDVWWHIGMGVAVVLAILVVGGLFIPWVRRKFHPAGRRPDGSLVGGFSIDRIEAMRGAGEISDEEFRALRRAALGLGPAREESSNSPLSAPETPDDDGMDAEADRPCADGDVERE
jgi:hypothetical protein